MTEAFRESENVLLKGFWCDGVKKRIMNKFEILIASIPKRDKVVAEIWFREVLIAEVNQENNSLEIGFFSNRKMVLLLDDFLGAIEVAKNKLAGR